MIRRKLITEKTARYFLSREPDDEVEEVIFVCHGYAQLADEFLNEFSPAFTSKRMFVAPEGLHRFYAKGSRDKVVASWMTKEDRLDDIRDYLKFLNSVAEDVLIACQRNVRISLVGFSQGAATASRWFTNTSNFKFNKLILWCGFFPLDMQKDKIPSDADMVIITATNDRFISEDESLDFVKEVRKTLPDCRHIHFSGGHEIDRGVLLQLFP